jgi:autotransporter translocation and assembly factor TamB
MRRALRWTLRIVIGVLALIGLAVVTAVIVIHTSYGRELVRSKAEAALASAFPGSTIASIGPCLV